MRPKLLTVDDDPVNNEVVGIIFKDQFEIKSVTSGLECLSIVPLFQPDLILLDVAMPYLDGFEVCRQLKQKEITQNIPIIFLTAKTSDDHLKQGLALGAIDYIKKPFTQVELAARVNTGMRIKKIQDELKQTLELQKQINTKLVNEILERQQAEKALLDSQKELTRAQTIARLGNWSMDIEHKKIMGSVEFFKILGVEKPNWEIEFKTFLNLVHNDDQDYLENAFDNAINQQSPFRLDHRIIRKNKEERLVHQEAEIVHDEFSHKPRFVGILQDITEIRRAAEIQAAYLKQNEEIEAERARIAKDLHDEVLQIFGLMESNLPADHSNTISTQNHENLHVLINSGKKIIRQVINHLHPPILEDLGLVPALRSYINNLKPMSSVNIEFKLCSNIDNWPLDIELAVLRIAQEALSNAIKHSRAPQAQVLLGQNDQKLWLQVEDEGIGFDVRDMVLNTKLQTHGLFFMRERAQKIGGDLEIQSQINEGTTIFLEISQ